MGPPTWFTIPVRRYMKTYGLTHEQLAMVSVVQRQWTGNNPRAPSGRRLPPRGPSPAVAKIAMGFVAR
jgi:hypothetical protein